MDLFEQLIEEYKRRMADSQFATAMAAASTPTSAVSAINKPGPLGRLFGLDADQANDWRYMLGGVGAALSRSDSPGQRLGLFDMRRALGVNEQKRQDAINAAQKSYVQALLDKDREQSSVVEPTSTKRFQTPGEEVTAENLPPPIMPKVSTLSTPAPAATIPSNPLLSLPGAIPAPYTTSPHEDRRKVYLDLGNGPKRVADLFNLFVD